MHFIFQNGNTLNTAMSLKSLMTERRVSPQLLMHPLDASIVATAVRNNLDDGSLDAVMCQNPLQTLQATSPTQTFCLDLGQGRGSKVTKYIFKKFRGICTLLEYFQFPLLLLLRGKYCAFTLLQLFENL